MPDTVNDEHAAPGPDVGGGDPQVRGDVCPMKSPRNCQWFVSFGDDARHLSKPPLIHHIRTEGQRKQFWRL